jgi:hypothetical protein
MQHSVTLKCLLQYIVQKKYVDASVMGKGKYEERQKKADLLFFFFFFSSIF